MKPAEIPGRKIGERCPGCKRGRLSIITRNVRGSNNLIGPGGRSWNFNLIERLACARCSASFEVEIKLRGTKLEDLLDGQLKDFKNPKKKPATCRPCGVKKLVVGVHFLRHSFKTYQHGDHDGETPYLYCGGCYTVYWVDALVEPPGKVQERKELAERLAGFKVNGATKTRS